MQQATITATGPCVIAEIVDMSAGTITRRVYADFKQADSFGLYTSKYTVPAGKSEQIIPFQTFDVDAYLDAMNADPYFGRDQMIRNSTL